MDTDGFTVYIKRKYIYSDIEKSVKTSFDTYFKL